MLILQSTKRLWTVKLNILGFDPSLRNWGVVQAQYDLLTHDIIIKNGYVIQHKPKKDRHIKQNTLDLQTANYIKSHLTNADIVIAEVPHGSQSSRAMVSYGVCIGVLGSLYDDLVQVSANDVKRIVEPNTAIKAVSKEQVIDWVINKHPEILSWLPKTRIKEHICDAIVALYAGINKPKFKELIHEINSKC